MKKLLLIGLLAKIGLMVFSGCDTGSYTHNFSQEDLEKMNLALTVGYNPSANGTQRAFVKVAFTKPWDGDLFFILPKNFMRKKDLDKRIVNMKVVSGRADVVKTSQSNVIRVVGDKDERVVLRYNILGYDPLHPFRKPSFSAALVEEDYLMFAGSQGLVLPAIRDGIKIPMTYEWEIPTDFEAYTNFNIKKTSGKIVATYNSMLDSLFVAGKGLRQVERTINGNTLEVVVKGNFAHVTDAQIADTLERLITTQRNELDDHSSPYFLASFFGREGSCPVQSKIEGYAHVNSFRAAFYEDCEVNAAGKLLVSHELMHNWIGKKLSLKPKSSTKPSETKWFSEGFTDFFGRVMALKAGIINKNEYFDSLNKEQLIPYYSSKNRNQKLSYIAENYSSRSLSSDSDLDKIPYKQGEIMALTLNEDIFDRNNSYGLIDVLRDAIKKVKDIPYDGTLKSRVFLDHEEFQRIIDKYAPNVFAPLYQKIVAGETLEIPNLKNCLDRKSGTNERVRLDGGKYLEVEIPSGFSWYHYYPPAITIGACNQLLK